MFYMGYLKGEICRIKKEIIDREIENQKQKYETLMRQEGEAMSLRKEVKELKDDLVRRNHDMLDVKIRMNNLSELINNQTETIQLLIKYLSIVLEHTPESKRFVKAKKGDKS